MSATRGVLRGAIGVTEDLGTSVVSGAAHISTELVHGVSDLGYEVRNGATGLIGAVGDIGSTLVGTVANVLVDVVGGVRQVVGAVVDGKQAQALQRPLDPDADERSTYGRAGHRPVAMPRAGAGDHGSGRAL